MWGVCSAPECLDNQVSLKVQSICPEDFLLEALGLVKVHLENSRLQFWCLPFKIRAFPPWRLLLTSIMKTPGILIHDNSLLDLMQSAADDFCGYWCYIDKTELDWNIATIYLIISTT